MGIDTARITVYFVLIYLVQVLEGGMVDSAAGGVSQLPTLTTYHFYRKGLGNMGMEISIFDILLY